MGIARPQHSRVVRGEHFTSGEGEISQKERKKKKMKICKKALDKRLLSLDSL